MRRCALACIALLCGCGPGRVEVEVFAVSAAAETDTLRYARRSAGLWNKADPDSAVRALTRDLGAPAILHSTSWRWEPDGRAVLTYLAYYEDARFRGRELPWASLAAPAPTNPLHPRPVRIREEDVLAHGLRHLSFLVRYARDGRLAAALSPRSRAFFRGMCGQLAGRLETAREFQECAAIR